jgi:hypothetical protein
MGYSVQTLDTLQATMDDKLASRWPKASPAVFTPLVQLMPCVDCIYEEIGTDKIGPIRVELAIGKAVLITSCCLHLASVETPELDEPTDWQIFEECTPDEWFVLALLQASSEFAQAIYYKLPTEGIQDFARTLLTGLAVLAKKLNLRDIGTLGHEAIDGIEIDD